MANSLQRHYLLPNIFLNRMIKAYYSLDYINFGAKNNPDFINVLKNDFNKSSQDQIIEAGKTLSYQCMEPLQEIILKENIDVVCIVPRAKTASYYTNNQIQFKRVIRSVIKRIVDRNFLSRLEYQEDFIERHTNTKTTHFHNKPEYGGDGDMPYPGITKDTCHISSKVRGKNVLLIDDIYTKTINIDEDCIQALLDNGAKNVILYTVAKTIKKF